ncbi:MAG: NHLP bacteriocin export ABC transporter permease/ATPase subunit [Gammaproteobacteria bacterium]
MSNESFNVDQAGQMTMNSLLKEERLAPCSRYQTQDYLLAVCEKIGEKLKVKMHPLPNDIGSHTIERQLQIVSEHSDFIARRVTLEERWWNNDFGPLIVFHKETLLPYAAIPDARGKYRFYDPRQQTWSRFSSTEFDTLSSSAYCFYRSFPKKKLNWRDLFSFIFSSVKRDAFFMIAFQTIIVSLGLIFPIVLGVLLQTVVPSANLTMLTQFVILLVINILVVTMVDFAQMISLIRLQLKANIIGQSAVWERLLHLPTAFFSRYLKGDLAMRAGGVDAIQQALTGEVISSIVNGLFSILTFILLFVISHRLALVAVLLAIILVAVNVFASIIQLKYQRKLTELDGVVASVGLQLINNIAKLRYCCCENVGMKKWMEKFSERTLNELHAGKVVVRLEVFQTMYAVIITLILFGLVVALGEKLSFGEFITFNAAFLQFFGAVMSMALVVASIIEIVPEYERMLPILHEVPEEQPGKLDPGKMTGAFELSYVSFTYPGTSGHIFKNLSLKAQAGQHIAVVGPSGSGKSTIARLLLGFEKPLSGSVMFDGQDLNSLNMHRVREQIGLVLQTTQLLTGSIFENIAFSPEITRDDVWEVLERVDMAEDVRKMPMGLDTVVFEFGRSFSRGQQQRLILARALMKNPNLLILDEATSALDNRTQSIVIENLKKMTCTRLTIAHRMSTIQDVDYIYVLQQGEIVQSGTYKELLAQDGLFALLVKRQQFE